ncbi:hypothetical protein QTP70_008609 [Hemibagrus guttatus]|uniref:Uncharacterized protein n=1 Tax=Hemibagrus guttatus TaxID=175788 RepID=A0AAE0UY97_9TELE|nr:hypothetical protein QTP70_008609 [Hemibagrus guttatus]
MCALVWFSSGLLSAKSFFSCIQRSEDKPSLRLIAHFLFRRFKRIQPLHLFIVCVIVALFSFLHKGPFWFTAEDQILNCKVFWWSNLLLINNLITITHTCAPWTWYLSVDFQFYATTPFLIFLYRLDYESYFEYYYNKPYTRYGPYVIGILAGIYILTKKEDVIKQQWQAAAGWLVSLSVMAMIVGSAYTLRGQGSLGHAVYQGLHRSLWALAVAWVIVACEEGYGGFVNKFLSMNVWVPLSNISFACYLVHPLLILLYNSKQETLVHYTDLNFCVMENDLQVSDCAGWCVCVGCDGAYWFCMMEKVGVYDGEGWCVCMMEKVSKAHADSHNQPEEAFQLFNKKKKEEKEEKKEEEKKKEEKKKEEEKKKRKKKKEEEEEEKKEEEKKEEEKEEEKKKKEKKKKGGGGGEEEGGGEEKGGEGEEGGGEGGGEEEGGGGGGEEEGGGEEKGGEGEEEGGKEEEGGGEEEEKKKKKKKKKKGKRKKRRRRRRRGKEEGGGGGEEGGGEEEEEEEEGGGEEEEGDVEEEEEEKGKGRGKGGGEEEEGGGEEEGGEEEEGGGGEEEVGGGEEGDVEEGGGGGGEEEEEKGGGGEEGGGEEGGGGGKKK